MGSRNKSRGGLALLLSFVMLISVMAEPLAVYGANEPPSDAGDENEERAEAGFRALALPSGGTAGGLARLGDEFKVVLDDYNDAAVDDYNRNPASAGTIAIIDSPFGEGLGKALQFSYNLSQGYNGVIHRRDAGGGLPLNGQWPGLSAIELWAQIPSPHQNPILQLNIGDTWPGISYEVDLRQVAGFDAGSAGPQHLVIPIRQFLIKGGTTPIPSTDNVISFSMYLGGSGTGNVILDEVKLIFAKEVEIDGFESYADDAALAAAWPANSGGGANTVTRSVYNYGDGDTTAMSFSYDAETFNSRGYTGVVKPAAGQDWTGTGAIGLWFTGDGLGQDILLQITSGQYYHAGWGVTIASSMEAHLNDLEGFDPYSTAPQYLLIPISEFKPKESGMAFYPDDMKGFGLYVNRTSDIATSSALTLDGIVRYVPYGSQPVGSGEVVFNGTTMTAQGDDNLIAVLNGNATVENGGRIVGVSYESNNEAVLRNYDGYIYKGVFRAPGTVRLNIASVMAEIGGVVQEIAIDGEITIEVSALDHSRDVLQYLRELRDSRVQNGIGLLTAMHNKEPNTNPRESTDRVLNMTGETPAIWSGDFLYQARDVAARQTMIDEAIRQWNDGSLINMMLHVAPPSRTVEQEKTGSVWDDRSATANQNGVQAYLSEEQWQSLLTEGGELNANWKLRLDEYYRYLVQLKDAGVTVMFRPFHEMNQHVFWWNGNPAHTTALYRLTHDYLTKVKGLDNLIWVWNVQDLPAGYGTAYGYDATNWQAFNPGEEYWDIFTLDVYDAAGFTTANYNRAVAAAGDKPMAIGECWVLPTQQELAAQPNWVFAMPWAGDTFTYNSASAIKAFYQNNLSIEDTPAFQTRRSGTEIIDSFENYADNAALAAAYVRDAAGGSNTVVLSASPFSRAGRHAISMTYATSSASGYSGTFRELNPVDISGAQSINLWFQGNGNSGQTVLVQLATGDDRFQFDLLDLRGYDATSKRPQYIEIPLDAFKPLTAGAVFDESSLTGIGFYVKKLGGENRSGTLLFDDISYSSLVPAKEAPPFKVSLTDTEWTASGSDTLMKLLKEHATILPLDSGSGSDEPYILQVLYDSGADRILRNEGLFSSKGIFREEGQVEVEIRQVTVYSGNRRHYIDVNQTVTINVGSLAEPVNVLDYLKALTGSGTLSAMHNKEPNERPRITTDRIMETTGVTPAIWSGDFLFLKEDVANRQVMINEAIRQWNDGALINIMFHVTSPTRTVAQEKEGADWSGSGNAVQTNLTTEQWASLLTDGGELNTNWKQRLDEYASYLQQLEDAGVVPMVRPFHEMNQHAFWWAGIPENTAALYRLTKDYLVNVKGLDNMIWMWNVQDFDNRMNWDDYNPGNAYWDILTLDAYTNGLGSRADDYYAQMKQYAAAAGGEDGPKPIGIGESFRLLGAAGLDKYKDYVMMMPWADDAWVYNTDEQLREFYDHTLSILDTPVFASTLDVDEPAPYTMTLDDFSGYADSEELAGAYARNTHGGNNEMAIIPSPFGDGLGNAMQFTYSFANGYSGRSRAVNGYWPGLEAVELWIQSDGSGHDILLQLSDGASYETHLNALPGFNPASTEPQHLVIPVGEFRPKSGSGVLNTRGITSFALYVNQVGGGTGGTMVMDEIKLVFAEQPALPDIGFASASLQADGIGNLIALLNAKATLPAGARIVQAAYESDNEAVLPNVDRFAPKGDFLSEGNAGITLKQVKLYMDGTTFTLDVNANLSITVSNLPERVDVVDYIRSVTGNGVLSAMHHDQSYANPASNDVLHQRIANEFGVYPALYSADFLSGGTVPYRQNMINEVIRQWKNGNLVQIMFHVSPPQYTVAQEAEGGWGGDQAHETLPSPNRIFSYLYNDAWEELMTDGTPLNANWKLRMDEYARLLQQLEDAGVTVMLRPFHEMNQHVFWWGGRPGLEGSAGLYRMFHDYMEVEKGLSNIVWVWNIQDLPDNYGFADGDAKFDRYEGLEGGLAEYDANDWNSFNPGRDYYDILSVDFYDVGGYATKYYEQARAIAEADGKPMIIGETFVFPTQEELVAQPDWSLAMPWGIRTWNYNTKEAMATFYENSIGISGMPRFATRDNFASQPVDRSRLAQAVAEAAELVERDYTASSWTAFRDAREAAQAVLSRGDAEQGEVDHALEALQAARGGLVRRGADGGSGGTVAVPEIGVGTGGSGVSVPYSKNGMQADLAISDGKLKEIMDKLSAAGGEASFDLSALDGIASVSLPTGALQKLAESGIAATFKLPDGTISMNEEALSSIAEQATGATIAVSLEAADLSVLTPKQLEAADGKRVYDISIASVGKRITSFAPGELSISLPYVLGEGETASGVAIWYIDEAGHVTEIPCVYDEELQIAAFTVNHLSYYAVGYEDADIWVNPFADVSEGDWFYDDVAYAVRKGLFLGTSETEFQPESGMTRAMLAAVLQRLAGAAEAGDDIGYRRNEDNVSADSASGGLDGRSSVHGSSTSTGYADVAADAWYSGAVVWATELGIVTGYGDGRFGPNDAVTREQLAVILYRYAGTGGGQPAASTELASFADGATVSPWAQEALEWAVGNGLVGGKANGDLDPKAGAKRAEVAAILRRFAEHAGQY